MKRHSSGLLKKIRAGKVNYSEPPNRREPMKERLWKTLRNIANLEKPSVTRQINGSDAEELCDLNLVEAIGSGNYRITDKGKEALREADSNGKVK
jgi:hypothetical protein